MLTDVTNRQAASSPARLRTNPTNDAADRELRQLEREAQDVRRAFAADPTVRLVVGLDLAIRRAALRLGDTWRALWASAAAPAGRRHQHPTRS